jgi:hypothetical protein
MQVVDINTNKMQVVDINTSVATDITTSSYKNNYFNPKFVRQSKHTQNFGN